MPTRTEAIIPGQELLQEPLDVLETAKKDHKYIRRALKRIEGNLPSLFKEYTERHARVGDKLGLIPPLVKHIKNWAREAGQPVFVPTLQYPDAPDWETEILKGLISLEKNVPRYYPTDAIVHGAYQQFKAHIEHYIEVNAELRLLNFYQQRIPIYCLSLYEIFLELQATQDKAQKICLRYEDQILGLLEFHDIRIPTQARKRGITFERDTFRHSTRAADDSTSEFEALSDDELRLTARDSRRSHPSSAIDVTGHHEEKSSAGDRVFQFFKWLWKAISRFFRSFPPFSWIFPIKNSETKKKKNFAASRENKKEETDLLPTRSFTRAYRASGLKQKGPSHKTRPPSTPKTVNNRRLFTR